MKKDIHPKYGPATVTCGCGNSWGTRSTKAEIRIEVCSKCHPFYTGTQKFLDTAGRVEKFQRKYKWTEEGAAKHAETAGKQVVAKKPKPARRKAAESPKAQKPKVVKKPKAKTKARVEKPAAEAAAAEPAPAAAPEEPKAEPKAEPAAEPQAAPQEAAPEPAEAEEQKEAGAEGDAEKKD